MESLKLSISPAVGAGTVPRVLLRLGISGAEVETA